MQPTCSLCRGPLPDEPRSTLLFGYTCRNGACIRLGDERRVELLAHAKTLTFHPTQRLDVADLGGFFLRLSLDYLELFSAADRAEVVEIEGTRGLQPEFMASVLMNNNAASPEPIRDGVARRGGRIRRGGSELHHHAANSSREHSPRHEGHRLSARTCLGGLSAPWRTNVVKDTEFVDAPTLLSTEGYEAVRACVYRSACDLDAAIAVLAEKPEPLNKLPATMTLLMRLRHMRSILAKLLAEGDEDDPTPTS